MKLRNTLLFCVVLLSSPLLRGQSVGLVLSGGASKGLSHIGVIMALEENNIPIDYIAGTSIGSIIGGMYAIGMSPDDMIALFRSEEFASWYKGEKEKEFSTYLYRGYPTPAMASVGLQWDKDHSDPGKRKFKLSLPTSLVSTYPMDFAFLQLFSNASAAAGYDFANLMVPYFCVSADVLRKKPFVSTEGDLGSAIRASMTFPGYFKPIMIDSVLLFDGGFYNNFPWELMEEIYDPDIIIGAKCVKGEKLHPDQEDIYNQLETIMTVDTDYDMPDNKGIMITGKYDYSFMDFDKLDELVKKGYENTMARMDEIKSRVTRRRSGQELDSLRIAFRQRCPDLIFDSVSIEGDLTPAQKSYIANTITDKRERFSSNQAKRGYYRIISTNTVRTFYPTATLNADSLYTLHFQTTPKNMLSLSLGGNISSTSLMQGYLGFSHTHFSPHPWNASVNLDIGQFFTGAGLYFRQHIGIKPLFIYEIMANIHQFDYFSSSQSIIFSNSLASNIRETEYYVTLNAGTPIYYSQSIMFEFGVTGGFNKYRYFPTESYTKYDMPDITEVTYVTPRIKVAQSTLDYNMYPTLGKERLLEFRYIFSHEGHEDGTVVESEQPASVIPYKHTFLARVRLEDYYSLNNWLSLGYCLEVTASTAMKMNDYISTMIVSPAFQPTVHSKTLMLPGYRAPLYAGLALSPVFKFTNTLYFHVTAGYFQPYRELLRSEDGGYRYSDPFPKGGFLGNVAFVWQSPIGPLSLSCAYYDKAEKAKWYPSFNIGFLIFRDHGLKN